MLNYLNDEMPDLRIETAENGMKALDRIVEKTPSVLVTNIVMPGMNGIDLLKALHEKGLTLPTLATSGFWKQEGFEQRLEAEGIGADNPTLFLQKPFDFVRFKALVDMLRQYRSYDFIPNMKRKDRYSIVWKPFQPSVGLVKATGSISSLPIPLFLTGKDLETCERYQGFVFYPLNVIRGILVGLQDNPPAIDLPSIKPFLIKALYLINDEAQAGSMEEMILSGAAYIKEYNGPEPSILALRTGCEICPESSKIASDLVMTLWEVAELVQNEESRALEEIAKRGTSIDLKQIDPKIVPLLVYVVAAALFFRHDPRASQYYEDFVINNLSDKRLLQRIDGLRNGRQFRMAEMLLGF